MSHFSFLCRTKTSFGKNALEHLPFDLYAMGRSKPMVIQDKSCHEAGMTKPLISAFKTSGMTLGICPPLPETDGDEPARIIRSMYETYMEKGYDALIALGGEQAADTAKALNIAVTLGPEALQQDGVVAPLFPMVYLPTGVKTGTATGGRAQFNGQTFVSDFLAPDQVVADPSLFIADDRETLLDAALTCLAMGCEVFGLSENPPARAYAAAIIQLAVHPLKALMDSGLDPRENLKQRKKEEKIWQKDLVQAAVMTGYLSSFPLLTRVLGLKLTADIRFHQGQAMVMVLPYILESIESKDVGSLLLPLAGPDVFSQVPAPQRPDSAVQILRSLVNELHLLSGGRLPRTLEEAGWNEAALSAIGQGLIKSGSLPAGTVPQAIEALLTRACSGRPAIRS